MVSLVAKKINGGTYYYMRRTAWVDGKSKVVEQKYLGSAEAIVNAVQRTPGGMGVLPGSPVLEFGAVAALYDLAKRLEIVEIIDRFVPKKGNRGPSVGTMLLLAAINRAVGATSKAQLGIWFERTSLPRWTKLKSNQLTSQRFWDNMDRVPEEAIVGVERELSTRIVKEFALDTRCLFYDATNFFSFIDTFNTRSKMAQRGKSKEGRASLRIFGLALLVTGDFEVPLFHYLYPGNQNDPTSFRSVVHELVERYRLLVGEAENLTLVFDKGNNTEDTLDVIAEQYHFVGSLKPGHHPDLLGVSRKRFRRLDPDLFPDEVTAYRTTKEVFGRTVTVLATYNENLFEAQTKTIEREVGKRQGKLRELQHSLRKWHAGSVRGGQKPSVGSVRKKADGILRGQHMKDLFSATVTERPDGLPELRYRFLPSAYAKLQRTQLGINILFTDKGDWTDEQIVAAYRGQYHVENAFRQMKDVHYVSFRPARHWTDQKVQVHAFTCVLALILCALLRRELARKGVKTSIDQMLESLGTIREVQVLLSSGRGRPRVRTTHSKLEPLAEKIFKALDLEKLLPT